VRTAKFIEEEKADAFRFSTWSMRRPGGVLANLGGGHTRSQAGVTVYPFNDRLYAFDEVSPAYGVDPTTLATLGEERLGDPAREFMIKAHTKFDPLTGEWLLFGISHGATMKLHMIVHAGDGALKEHRIVASPRQIYIHDFFATRNHFVFVLHPMMFSPFRLLTGQATYIESLKWKPQDGNVVMVLSRDGSGEPLLLDAPAAFIWHALNAYEEDGAIVADFVGYDAPDHFAPHDALFYRLMQGELGTAQAPGKLRRYRMDLRARSLREEIVDSGSHEFPMIDPRAALQKHAIGYFTCGRGPINGGVKRVDYRSGAAQTFDFGPNVATGEPVFAAKPDGSNDDGWLIVQCLDGATERAFFALFNAGRLDAGPIARIHLPHHLPLSFHGWWKAD
jgi:all-trans-8'-apo-beta-carotenal 15,15'-oxygenase